MKKLTKEEKDNYSTRPLRRLGPVRACLMNMKPADTILIESHEWSWTTKSPSFLCRRVEEETGWKFECEKILGPGGGWIVTRLS